MVQDDVRASLAFKTPDAQGAVAKPCDDVIAPSGWYFACRTAHLKSQPREMTIGLHKYVAFRGDNGRPAVLDARCSHLGANLANGIVTAGTIRCPLHGWEYGSDGRCRHIPAALTIPPFACQRSYPTNEVGGCVYFCNRPAAPHDMPFFDGLSPDDLVPAVPFALRLNMPWYMVTANAFDLQHFRTAHDRRLMDKPVVDSPSPQARRIVATYEVVGKHWRDELTRRLGGPQVTISATVWRGTMMIASARFARTTSYGLVSIEPLNSSASLIRVVVWVPRRSFPGAVWINHLDAALRRSFVRAFLSPDITATAGIRYTPGRLIDADRELADYLEWLTSTTGCCIQ